MATGQLEIRLVRLEDNVVLAQVFLEELIEMKVPFDGTALSDPELDAIYDAYQYVKADYWIVCYRNRILECAGIAPLRNGPYWFYELQKMYFLLKTKEKGLGSKMMRKCLQQAKRFDFTDCYIETMPNMIHVQKLYQKWGFEHFEHPLGNTNPCSYPVWIVKLLEDDT
ncbi:MAG: GNAT family N-acetyltransferase [Bacteroidota bacterium]|nr:GNAT family N-acetyltransferase [Bacteroidota bacterium]